MKNKLLIILSIALFATINLQAQTKIGYFDVQYVLPQMPEFKTAQSELETFGGQLEKELKRQETEFKQKYDIYIKEGNGLPESVRAAREKELADLQQNIQKFQTDAQRQIQEKESKLLAPIYKKIEDNINVVAKEGNYTYIIRIESLLFEKPENNISDTVLKKMGITPQAKN